MENVITLGKLIGLLFCSLPPLYFVFENSKNTWNELACPVMRTIFLIGRAKRATHWGVQSRFRVIGERAKRVRHTLLLPIEKKFGRKYVKTTMRMLTILREAEGVDARASRRSLGCC